MTFTRRLTCFCGAVANQIPDRCVESNALPNSRLQAKQANEICNTLIQAVELIKMREIQHFQAYKRAHTQANWMSSTSVTNSAQCRARVAERQGRHPMMSPLPDELPLDYLVPPDQNTVDEGVAFNKGIALAAPELIEVTPEKEHTAIAGRQMDRLQAAMDDHSLSPIGAEARLKAKEQPKRRSKNATARTACRSFPE